MEGLEIVASELPVWIRVGAGIPLIPLAFAGGVVACWLATGIASLGCGRAAEAHWTERAQLFWPGRLVARLAAFVFAGIVGSHVALTLGPLSALPSGVLGVAAGLAGYAGAALVGARFMGRVTGEPRGVLQHMRGELRLLLLLAPQLPVVIFMGIYVRADGSAASALAAVAGVLLFGATAIWGILPLARWTGALRPASTRIQAAVDRVAQRCAVLPKAVFEIDLPMANAFAIPTLGWLVFTDRCGRELDDGQIEAIAGHELGHLAEPRSVRGLRVASGFALLPVGFVNLLIGSLGLVVGLLAMYVGVFAVVVPISRLRIRLEERADHHAHRLEQQPGVYARALERLYQLNLVPVVGMSRKGTSHPHLYDRLLAMGAPPAYPRPAAPSRLRLMLGSVGAVTALAGLVIVLEGIGPLAARAAPDAETEALVSLALDGGTPDTLFALAVAWSEHRPGVALAATDHVLSRDPAAHHAHAVRSRILSGAGSCARAATAYSEAVMSLVDWSAHIEVCQWLEDARSALSRCEWSHAP